MAIQWTDAYSTGVPEIDRQHQELIRQVNALSTAMAQGAGKEQIIQTLTFMVDYAAKHFREEEAVMDRHHCPAAAENRAAHQKFVQTVTTKLAQLKTKGVDSATAVEVLTMLSTWLNSHILKVDCKLKGCAAVRAS